MLSQYLAISRARSELTTRAWAKLASAAGTSTTSIRCRLLAIRLYFWPEANLSNLEARTVCRLRRQFELQASRKKVTMPIHGSLACFRVDCDDVTMLR